MSTCAAERILLEIDLLRHGTRSIETQGLQATTYLVSLSSASNRRQLEVWPVNLSDPLPVVAVPLRPEDGDVPLDLGAALSVVYDRARYDLSIDYTTPPAPALENGDQRVGHSVAAIQGILRTACQGTRMRHWNPRW